MVRQESAKLSFPGSNPGVTSNQNSRNTCVSGVFSCPKTGFSLIFSLIGSTGGNCTDKTLHAIGTFALHLVGHMAVYVQRKGRCGVAQISLHCLDVVPGADRGDCVGVTQVMETGISQRGDSNPDVTSRRKPPDRVVFFFCLRGRQCLFYRGGILPRSDALSPAAPFLSAAEEMGAAARWGQHISPEKSCSQNVYTFGQRKSKITIDKSAKRAIL